MIQDPYAPPQATLAKSIVEPTMPVELLAMILSGVSACALSVLADSFGMLRLVQSHAATVYLAFVAFMILVMIGLGYGIYRGSRTCAALGLATYLLLHGIVLVRNNQWPNWMTLVMAMLYLLGVIGTFRWQAWRAAQLRAADI